MLLIGAVQAQVTLDGTLGRAGPLRGPNYAITADLGQQRGGNLFHSFGLFSIPAGESATFSGPNSVNNIIGRVTGGQVSTIDGALRSTIPGANLYLLNPAGVLFGENALLDVPGSVHVSTADYLRLSDGGRFDARTPGSSVLTVAPVEAFGFLGDTPGRIDINGSFLRVPEGQTLSLIGGDITLTNATVYAPAGRINIAAVGSAGEVIPTETDLSLQGFGPLGTLTMARDPDVERVTVDLGEPFGEVPVGDLDASGEGGGAIFIRGGQWVSRGGKVLADTYGAQAGQAVDVAIAGAIRFEEDAWLWITTYGRGDCGDIHLIVPDTLTLLKGSRIFTTTVDAQGDVGSITVTAGNLVIDGQGNPFTGIDSQSLAVVGDIHLTVADTLTLINGGRIRADTWGAGDAGSVTIRAGNLLVDGQGFMGFTGIASDTNTGSTGPAGTSISPLPTPSPSSTAARSVPIPWTWATPGR
jgi:filamentous hemagglutinin family protein